MNELEELLTKFGCKYQNNVFLFEKSPLSCWYGAFPVQSSPIKALIYTELNDGCYFTFNCAEQYLMAKKAALFLDWESVNKILDEKHPRRQQQLGREVKNFCQLTWEKVREIIWHQVLYDKFTQNDHLKNYLTSIPKWTIIAESSIEDKIYGNGLSINDPAAFDTRNWTGQNLLGKILMKVRDNL